MVVVVVRQEHLQDPTQLVMVEVEAELLLEMDLLVEGLQVVELLVRDIVEQV